MVLAGYFALRFVQQHGALRLRIHRSDVQTVLVPALTIGASTALSMINYNFDSAMLGFLAGPAAVGWYGAAYKPVTVVLAMPLTYFMGMFSVLSATYARDTAAFRRIFFQSLRLSASVALPIGVGGTLLAQPIIVFLFGPSYTPAVPVLKLLVWSAVLVILRAPFRHGITAPGHFGVDLRCAIVSAGLNVAFNIVLIPRYGMLGAATATLAAELIWLLLVVNRVNHYGLNANPIRLLSKPLLAALAMAATLYLTPPLFWMLRGAIACAVYGGVLLAVSGGDRQEWLAMLKQPMKPSP
jgi:O-antigen/teichoic acid export membrane protein